MYILGLNAAGFNTSAALLRGEKVLSAVEEERLNRQKKTRAFPHKAIDWVLSQAGIRTEDLEAICVGWNPAINLEAYSVAQSGRHRYLGELLYSVASALIQKAKSNVGDVTTQTISLGGKKGPIPIVYVRHHLCHAANFFQSPFEKASIVTFDAFGEKESCTISEGRQSQIELKGSVEFPHSLGGFYSSFTEFLGFEAQSDEWKLMGASSYGAPGRFRNKIRKLYNLLPKGHYELDLSFFNFYQFHRPGRYTEKLEKHLGLPALKQGDKIPGEYYDLAAAVQEGFEAIYFHVIRHAQKICRSDSVVLSGGCAMNSLANGKVRKKCGPRKLFIPSAPDDSGVSVGSAAYYFHVLRKNKKSIRRAYFDNLLGPEFSRAEIEQTLKIYKTTYARPADLDREVVDLLVRGKVVGWFQGRLEFGDRSLGCRSILADPRDAKMCDKVNESIKYREKFRPFAPAILEEHLHEYFEAAETTPYMEKVFQTKVAKKKRIPAVVHVDGTGRVQTVSKKTNDRFYRLIKEFMSRTGIPVLLNTSFNVKGEPVVCSPSDALRTFTTSGLDALALGDFLITKRAT